MLERIAHESAGEQEQVTGDDSWRSAKLSAARLLDRALAANGIDLEKRQHTWRVLEQLANDPDPTETDNWARSEPWTQAINTVRGEAMHAAMQYGLWCRRHLGIEAGQSTFEQVPELRQLLDTHLDVNRDAAPAIRSVYGQFYPWLLLMDRDWALENTKEIFPAATERQEHWYAAWGSYVLFDRPYDEVLNALSEQYQFACVNLGLDRPEWQSRNLDEPLAHHLMTYFWRGKLEDERGKTILSTFWKNARPETREDAIQFVGRSLSTEGVELTDEQRIRLMKLWEQRLNTPESAEELASFGYWFTSKQFAGDWSLEMLSATIERAGSVRDFEDVLEQLPTFAATYPLQAAKLLFQLIAVSNQPWAFNYREKETKRALEILIRSGVAEAEKIARECVDLLAARGHIDFRTVVPREGAQN